MERPGRPALRLDPSVLPQGIDWDLLLLVAATLLPGESLDLRTGKVSRVDLSGLENPGDAFPEDLNPPSPSQESGVSP